MEIGAGTNLGRYQLLAEIGRGAMGTVYQALDPEIERLVAIKTFALLDADSTEALAFRERFAQEARAAGRLAHPGIVTIYDRGEEPTTNTPYIVMEYVAGQPLSALLTGGSARLEERFALQVARDVAEALAYAHERGVIHRDIKPANILITEEGNAKVADFGVARLDTSNLTLNGEVFGTPAYMAPEQITGGQVDGRSDIFSLGVILYTMLIGFRPFQGNSPHTIGFKVVNQEPVPITSFHLDLSKDTEYVVARAMAKNPANRYQSGTEFAQDLTDILEGREPRSRQDVTVRVSAEVFRVAEGYRRLAFTKSAFKASHVSAFKDHPSTGHTPVSGPVLVSSTLPVAISAVPVATVTSSATAEPATPVLPKFKLPEFKLPRLKLPDFKVPDLKLPGFTMPEIKFPELRFPQISIPNWEVASLLLLGVACLGAISGFLLVHTQRVALHKADVEIGMPALLTEAISPAPALKSRHIEAPAPPSKPPRTKVAAAHPSTSKTKPPVNEDLDYTVIRSPHKQIPVAPVMVAATSAPTPAPKPSAPVTPPATLEVALQHHFTDADFSVWVDNKLAFSDSVHGEEKKRLLVLRGVEGKEVHDIHFPAGTHEIKVRVASASAQFDHIETLKGTFKETGKPVLNIHCNKHGLELKLAGGS